MAIYNYSQYIYSRIDQYEQTVEDIENQMETHGNAFRNTLKMRKARKIKPTSIT